MTEFSRLKQIALSQQLEPIRNVVVHWALPLAVGIAALKTAVTLLRRLSASKRIIDFNERFGARIKIFFRRILTLNV